MSDRFPTTITIYAVPDYATDDVLGLLDEYGFVRHDTDVIETGDTLALGVEYHDDECGNAYGIAQTLTSWDVAFVLHQDAKYEYDGYYYAHVPGVGSHEGTCTQDGELVITVAQVERILDTVDSMLGTTTSARIALDNLTGAKVRRAIDRLREVV